MASPAVGHNAAVGAPLRDQFPIFQNQQRRSASGVLLPLTFLDSAASAQKPQCVIDAMVKHMQYSYGSVHRGAYSLSMLSSELYESARSDIAAFVGDGVTAEEVVFTHGTTEALNLVALGAAEGLLGPNDRVVVAAAEHHANLVPWQQAALRSGCELAYIPFSGDPGYSYSLNLEKAEKLITKNTKIVAIAHVGNVLGQHNPLAEIIALAQNVGAFVVVDSAQSISSCDKNPLSMGAHAMAFGAHKMYGPTGVGALVGRHELLRLLPPLIFGGGMIADVTLEQSSWAPLPARFEAGTPPITEVVGFAEAARWLGQGGRREAAHRHCAHLATLLREGLGALPGVKIYSSSTGFETLVSFRHDAVHAHDLATVLDGFNVAVRAGHHCAWPLVRDLGADALVRASFGIYNDVDDVERCLEAIKAAPGLFQ